MEKYLQMLKTEGADLAMEIDTKTVVTAPWTALKCQFGCDFYGRKFCCPPNTPDWEKTQKIIDCYNRGILFRFHEMKPVTAAAVKVCREAFLDGYYKALAFGSGPCLLCEKCSTEHCNFPKKTAPAMEACGIDVFATVRNNGIAINTVREKGETANYFGMILID